MADERNTDLPEELQELQDLDEQERQKLKKLLEKEAKTYRSPTGLFKWIVAILGAAMVLFYFYTAGLAAVATQYHRGVYVFVTYVLVFLLYPVGKAAMRLPVTAMLGAILTCLCAALFYYPSPSVFHDQLLTIGQAHQDSGMAAAIGIGLTFWPLVLLAIIMTAALYLIDEQIMKRGKNNPTVSDVCFALLSAAVVYYWMHEFEALNYRAGAETDIDAMISIVGILLSLEVCRRVLGWSMTLIGISMFLYGYLGPIFPDVIAHRGFGIERLCTFLYLKTDGVFGVMASVLATYVILFIFFGAFLHKSGAGKFFIDLPLAIAGRTAGGPAKVAVIASALFGSVSGSAIANTVSTGAFTIPLMKRAGFRPHVAGAIEPAASIGGMFLPPVMGAGGFLMAELTDTPYSYIMMISVFPALLYFFSVFCMIHFEAKKLKIEGLDEEFPHWKVVLKREWYFSLPLVIITILMVIGRSPGYSAFWATISCIAISWVRKETRMGPKEIWEAIQTGAKNTLIIGATLGVIGMIVGTISLTGIGLKFSDIIISLANGNLLLALLLVGLASLVLGMGVPVTAAYLITAVLAVPPLAEMGVPILAAHMIVYWFSQDSNITPPVCVAAYAGAAIAGSDPWKTGWTSFKFAKLLYVMPILFAFTPSILFEAKPIKVKIPDFEIDMPFATVETINIEEGNDFKKGDVLATLLVGDQPLEIIAHRDGLADEVKAFPGALVSPGDTLVEGEVMATPSKIISSFVSAVLGTIAFSALTMLYWIRRTSVPEWLILAAATILLYWPTIITDVIGLALVAVVWAMQKTKNKREQAVLAAA